MKLMIGDASGLVRGVRRDDGGEGEGVAVFGSSVIVPAPRAHSVTNLVD